VKGNTRGLGLGMTGIVPPSTKTNMRLWGVSKWKGGRAVQGAGEAEDDDEDEKGGQGQEPASQTYTFGSHIVVEEGALLLTTSAAWEEAFHPTLGLMRRDRGGQRVEVDGVLPDERLRTIGDDVEWLVIDLRFVMGSEEYKDEQALLGGGEGADVTGATSRPGFVARHAFALAFERTKHVNRVNFGFGNVVSDVQPGLFAQGPQVDVLGIGICRDHVRLTGGRGQEHRTGVKGVVGRRVVSICSSSMRLLYPSRADFWNFGAGYRQMTIRWRATTRARSPLLHLRRPVRHVIISTQGRQ
jgi:hypothetical protein